MRDSSDEGRTDISTRMEWVMRIVSDQSMVTFEGTDTTKSLKLIQNLENLVAKKKGKGQRSKSMLKVVKGIERVDQIKEKQLESEEQEAPKLVVFLDEMDNTLAIYVVGDKCKIFTQTVNLMDSLIVLLAAYYVFDLEYPTMYSQALGILQHWVLGDPYTEQKGSNFIKFSDLLSRSPDRPNLE